MARTPVLKTQTFDVEHQEYALELERLHDAQLALESAEFALRGRVMQARSAGVTWAQIGQTLGTTRQAAQQRFS
jgi:hypothetical protein